MKNALPDWLKSKGKWVWFHELNKAPFFKDMYSPDVTLITALMELEPKCINVRGILKGGACLITVTNPNVL